MKRYFFVLLGFIALKQARAQNNQMDAFVDKLIHRMTLEEKIGQLNLLNRGVVTGSVVSTDVETKIREGKAGGIFGLYGPDDLRQLQKIAVTESRLHIPLFFGLDVIHGHKTIFPIPLALSCTWDMKLIEKSARIAASEATADGINVAFSPMVDIARDPRWGRVAEGSGEDPYLGSLVARAMIKGYQQEDLSANNTMAACVKHFALYGATEAGRDYNTVDMSPLKMFQSYLPPYKAAVEAGAAAVMTSFNDINGIPATGNKWLISDLLRKQWGFKGLVMSDYTAISEMINFGLGDLKKVSAKAFNAGTDMDMVSEGYLNNLKNLIREGIVNEQQINESCRRVLELKYKLGLFNDPYRYLDTKRATKRILTDANRKDALEVAERSFVLLKNEHRTLPLKKEGIIAVIGPLAQSRRDLLGTWVTAGNAENIVTALEGIKKEAGGARVLYAKGANLTDDTFMLKRLNFSGINVPVDTRPPDEMLTEAKEIAAKADVIVAVLGESYNMSGEASNRADIGLPLSQKKLFEVLVATGKPVVLVLVNGRPVTLADEDKHAKAILETFAGGIEAGNAIGRVLFGAYNPSAKLTLTFPRSVGQIPIYYNYKNIGRPFSEKDPEHTSAYLDVPNDPLYPFGYGLSYTSFEYGDLKLDKDSLKGNETLTASVTVTNTGSYAGEEIVQLYISDKESHIVRSVKELKAFKKISLQPGEKKEVSFTIAPDDLKFYSDDLSYDWESGTFIIHAGPNSGDVRNRDCFWQKL